MSNSPAVQKAALEVLEELKKLPKEEFEKLLNEEIGKIHQPTFMFICSFCGKNNKEVRQLIVGPCVSICDECGDICTEILVEERAKPFYDLRNAP